MTAAATEQLRLRRLAGLYGVQPSYYGLDRKLHRAPAESVMAVLRALGAPLRGLRDVPAVARQRRAELWRAALPPVIVAWEGSPAAAPLRLPTHRAEGRVLCRLDGEHGFVREWTGSLGDAPTVRERDVDGETFAVKRLPLLGPLPYGYYRFTVETAGTAWTAQVIAAPGQARGPEETAARGWGIFLPLYALRSKEDWGAGDFTLLRRFGEWVADQGGTVVGTLPLVAGFLDEPYEPSPYAPASRLAWNEFYLDITAIPELVGCREARDLLASSDLQRAVAEQRAQAFVDYREQMALKRRLLKPLAEHFFRHDGERRRDFESFCRSHPAVQGYARFRAAMARQRSTWPSWPEPMRDGDLRDGDYEPGEEAYHLYVQWLAHTQLSETAAALERRGARLYLDLPLGVKSDGYDIWHEQDAFVRGVSGGAPPDLFFTAGQDWGFPPLHPEGIRRQGHRYLTACLRHHLEHSKVLRIDHVMGLHRLFWIPEGARADEGVYVRYPADELYAVLCLEARRHEAVIVGENLGTVPAKVDRALERHRIRGMYMAQFQLGPDPDEPLPPPGPDVLAALNTHDMPTFAGYWAGLDLEDGVQLGILDEEGRRQEEAAREAVRRALVSHLKRTGLLDREDLQGVLGALLEMLAAGPASQVLVNLEDLWLETAPQNTPGTWRERPNWVRKARYGIEEFTAMPGVLRTLGRVARARGGSTGVGAGMGGES